MQKYIDVFPVDCNWSVFSSVALVSGDPRRIEFKLVWSTRTILPYLIQAKNDLRAFRLFFVVKVKTLLGSLTALNIGPGYLGQMWWKLEAVDFKLKPQISTTSHPRGFEFGHPVLTQSLWATNVMKACQAKAWMLQFLPVFFWADQHAPSRCLQEHGRSGDVCNKKSILLWLVKLQETFKCSLFPVYEIIPNANEQVKMMTMMTQYYFS